MTLLRAIARPMLASTFVAGGAMTLRRPDASAAKAQPVADLVQSFIPGTRISATSLVRLDAAVHVAAGLALATGRMPRTAAFVLAATMPATTATGHRFWEEPDPVARRNQFLHFLKNASMTGGLLMSTLDPEPGKPWLGARAKRSAIAAKDSLVEQVDELRR